MSRLSPLLSGVLAVEEGKVVMTVTPEENTLPADAYGIRVEPLRYALMYTALDYWRLKKFSVFHKQGQMQE